MPDRRLTCLFVCSLCAACASSEVEPRPDQEQARSLIRDATGQAEIYDPDAPVLSSGEIDFALADGLGLDESLRLALLNSRRLQAGFLGLGVARADYVQAGLLKNPTLGVSFLFPSWGGHPKITADLLQSLVDLWALPARQEVAGNALQERIFELSRFAGELVVDTKDAYFESVATQELLATARENATVAQSAFEAVQRRAQAGVATLVEQNLAEGQALGADLALRSAEQANFSAKRRLAALLSIEADLMEVELLDPLPDPRAAEMDREALVARSRTTRLDLKAAEAAVAMAEAQLALERRRSIPDVQVGLSYERPEAGGSGGSLLGPAASFELPIFDRNQAQVRRAELLRDQLTREYEALAADVGQEVRAAVDRAGSAARTAQFVSGELLPQAQRTLELVRTSYELGDTTLLALLESQRTALQARSTRISALLEAARTRVEIERAAGASLEALDRPALE